MNEKISELLASASTRVVPIRYADGRPLVKTKLLHAAAVAAAGVIAAPRLTAAAAVGALLKGITLTVDEQAEEAAPA